MKKYNTRKDVPEKYKWDLTDFYKDEEDFENSFKDLQIKTENLKDYKGCTKNNIYLLEYLEKYLDCERIIENLYV